MILFAAVQAVLGNPAGPQLCLEVWPAIPLRGPIHSDTKPLSEGSTVKRLAIKHPLGVIQHLFRIHTEGVM